MVSQLQTCQEAWYLYIGANATMTASESREFAKVISPYTVPALCAFLLLQFLQASKPISILCPQRLLDAYKCTILDAKNMTDPMLLYQNLLCADGYGGNMCGVCVPTASGQQTAMKTGSFNCE